jgi:tRNA pseudouridine32 synthase/23S rRNA pseudouridine746 synthase
MDTSGLMVFARGTASHRLLSMAFERKAVNKSYEALAWGEMSGDEGVVELPLIRDWPNRPKQKVDHENGKPSRTEWRVLERRDGYCRVSLTPVTGRTHQLRVHMAETGHGILGDCWYGTPQSKSAAERLCLHACELGFVHPVSGEILNFTSRAEF